MAVNIQKFLSEYKSGISIKTLADKYKLSEKQLNEAIQKKLVYSTPEEYSEYQKQLEEHNKKVNSEYNLAYEKLKSGDYMDALKYGLSATIGMFNPPQDPNINMGTAPCPVKWADIKSIFNLIKSLKNLPKIISNLKNCKTIQNFKSFMIKLAQDLKLIKPKGKAGNAGKAKASPKPAPNTNTTKTHAQLIQEASKGKSLIDMTDEELVLYYKKRVPGINREELKCLIDQVHRIKKGEPRWLNTKEERDLLESIQKKMIKYEKENSMSITRDSNGQVKRTLYDELKNKPADIPFEKKKLTEFQKNQLSGWYNKDEDACIKPIFEELGTVLDHDVYLYRCVTVHSEMSANEQLSQCNFLNSIKAGSTIDNGSHFNSTAKNINNTQNNYGLTFEQLYILKIKVPKGTKVLDMRHHKSNLDEVVLPPCSYKVNKIDYTTGIVDCDFIPH